MTKPEKTPYCWNCSQEPDWVVLSVNIAYFYCKSCKQEIRDTSKEPVTISSKAGGLKFGGGWGLKDVVFDPLYLGHVKAIQDMVNNIAASQFDEQELTHDPDYMDDSTYAAYYGWDIK